MKVEPPGIEARGPDERTRRAAEQHEQAAAEERAGHVVRLGGTRRWCGCPYAWSSFSGGGGFEAPTAAGRRRPASWWCRPGRPRVAPGRPQSRLVCRRRCGRHRDAQVGGLPCGLLRRTTDGRVAVREEDHRRGHLVRRRRAAGRGDRVERVAIPSPALRGPVRRVCTAPITEVWSVVGSTRTRAVRVRRRADLDPVGDLVDEVRGTVDGGLDPARGDVGGGHRRRDVDGQDDHPFVARHPLRLDRLGQPEDDEGQGTGRQDRCDVAWPRCGGSDGSMEGEEVHRSMARRRRRWTST